MVPWVGILLPGVLEMLLESSLHSFVFAAHYIGFPFPRPSVLVEYRWISVILLLVFPRSAIF